LSRDELEAALARPFHGLEDGTELFPTDLDKAVALFEGRCRIHHAFVDGNKRTAATLLLHFLSSRGATLEYSADELADFCVEVAAGARRTDEIRSWLAQRIRPERVSI
jgi:death-on-curing protein